MATPAAKSQCPLRYTPLNSLSSKVRVVLRVRPFLPLEIESKEKNPIPCITVLDPEHHMGEEEVTVHLKDQWSSRNECYKLDSFFGQDGHVGQIFHREVSPVIPGIFQGLNATIFAYGATGSGKTYTMQGTDDEPGLIPLAVSTILSLSDNTQYSVEISYYEVYLDRCYDLLEPESKEILPLDDKEGRLQLKGLSSVPLRSFDEFFEVFSTGIQRRKVAHTGLNDVSSRSHGVLSIVVTDGATKGKLNLIDLAGNEDNRRTGNEGIRLQESAKINQSLFALSNVIYALNNNEPRIPYRESKLTRILQDSLGGTSRALMVACLNPASYQEAVHTVSLAARSRHIVNNVGSANKKEVPKEKVDMEAKLRSWLESKGKTRSIQRKNGPFSPSFGITPTSVNRLKNPGSVQSSIKARTADRVVTNNKGRKLFDSAAPFSSDIDESILSSSTDVKDVQLPNEIGDFAQQIFHDGKEERSSDINTLKPLDLPGGTPFNKENLQYPTNTMGSPPIRQKIQENTSLREVLSPISSNITPNKHLSSEDKICLILLEQKTPKTPLIITCGKDKAGMTRTPLDKFNALSSNLKESLAQEYLNFLNVASKEELMQLKGIGQKRAEYLLELRENSPNPLKSLSDLEKIGISSKQVHDMFRRVGRGIFT